MPKRIGVRGHSFIAAPRIYTPQTKAPKLEMANSIRDQPLRKGPIQLNFGSYGNVFQLLALGAVTNAAIAGKLFNFELLSAQ